MRVELAVASAAGCLGVLLVAYARSRVRRVPLPPTLIISLRRRPAKRDTAVARAHAGGLREVHVHDAVDGRELSEAALERGGLGIYPGWRLPGSHYKWFDRYLKWGEVGCALSHASLWALLAESAGPVRRAGCGVSGLRRMWHRLSFRLTGPAWGREPEAVLILEDDADFDADFATRLRGVLLQESRPRPLPRDTARAHSEMHTLPLRSRKRGPLPHSYVSSEFLPDLRF